MKQSRYTKLNQRFFYRISLFFFAVLCFLFAWRELFQMYTIFSYLSTRDKNTTTRGHWKGFFPFCSSFLAVLVTWIDGVFNWWHICRLDMCFVYETHHTLWSLCYLSFFLLIYSSSWKGHTISHPVSRLFFFSGNIRM